MESLLDILEADETISIAPPPEPAAPSEEPLPEELPLEELFSQELLIISQVFDPDNVSSDQYEATKADIQDLIQRLDSIIKARNYNAWLEYLSDSYREEISSPEFLEEQTEELYERDTRVATVMGRSPRTVEKKILRTLKDYFDNLVVPSRANDRVDDITFISETKVRAYTVDNRGRRARLYDLEIIDGDWKIIG